MKKILSLSLTDNQSKGELEASVFRGHASVRILFHFEDGRQVDLWLRRDDAVELANALLTATKELEDSEPPLPSFRILQ